MKERIFKLIDIFEKDRKFYSNIKINNKGKENEQVLVKSGMDDYKEWKEENAIINEKRLPNKKIKKNISK